MTNEEILERVAKLEKGLTNPNIPAASHPAIKKQIDTLKSQLVVAEEKAEKKQEENVKEETEAQDKLQEQIKKLEKGLTNPNVPASTHPAIKKNIEKAKAELEKLKAEMKEDKQEAEKEKQEIKEAVKAVEEVAKKVVAKKSSKKKATKKGGKKPAPVPAPKKEIKIPEVKEKKRDEKSKERKEKLKGIMSDLEKLIEKHKNLAFYKGKDVDLEKDAARSAKPRGYRFVGKHDYRVPTPEQIKRGLKRGTIDYENRPNRSDANPTGSGKGKLKGIKLAHGGSLDADRFAKPSGWRWKDSAVEDGIIKKASLSKSPSERSRKMYPDYVAFEARVDKSDKHPSHRYQSLGKGGDLLPEWAVTITSEDGETHDWDGFAKSEDEALQKAEEEAGFESVATGMNMITDAKGEKVMYASGGTVTHSRKKDNQRFAKPRGWRWKDSAVEDGIVGKAALSKEPSAGMRAKYPQYVYEEKRVDKSDKNPSRKYISYGSGGGISKNGKTVTLKSGLKGNRNSLHNKYDDFEDFESYSEMYGLHEKLGYDTPQEAWDANPIVESGTNASDFRKVSKYASGGDVTHSRKKDNQRFAKPKGWRWKDSAVEDGIVPKSALSKEPSAGMRAKYPQYVYEEKRVDKSDKNPSRKYISYGKGGMFNGDLKSDLDRHKDADELDVVKSYDKGADYPYLLDVNDTGYFYANKEERDSDYNKIKELCNKKYASGGDVTHSRKKDNQRFAKPKGWRWKDSAVEDGIVPKSALSKEPSAGMREKHPDYVYEEKRVDKSDKKPSRKYISY